MWPINRLKSVMGPELCLLLPFVLAVSGSDTTSRLYGVGKGAALRKLRSDSAFKEATYVLSGNLLWRKLLLLVKKLCAVCMKVDLTKV